MKYDVYAMGNALVDMEFKVSDDFFAANNVEKGLMTLVEESRQEELLEVLKSSHRDQIKRQCGGSAANTVIAVSQFGGRSFYSCRVANDETGLFYLNDLKSNGVDTKHTEQTAPTGVTGKCMVLVSDDAERTMNTYLGITSTYSIDELNQDALLNSKWLYIEGYLVTGESGLNACLETEKIARDNGVKVAFTMSDPGIVTHFKSQMKSIIGSGVDLLFCNEDEARSFTDTDSVMQAREALKQYAKQFVITMGKNGAIIWDGLRFIDIESYNVDAIDSNGAGDMFAGAFLYSITNGHTIASAGTLASCASSKVVSQYGPRLETNQCKEVLNEVFGDK